MTLNYPDTAGKEQAVVLVIRGQRHKPNVYAGIHKGLPTDVPVVAHWANVDGVWIGKSTEEGEEYFFPFSEVKNATVPLLIAAVHAASLLIAAGVELVEGSMLFGHSELVTADLYIHALW